MYDPSKLPAPVFGDKDSGLNFIVEALKEYERAQSLYANKSESKSNESVKEVLAKVTETDPEAVNMAETIANRLSEDVLSFCSDNPNVSVVLFPLLEEIKKVVGSWRAETTVTITPVSTDSEDDRDLQAEYEALEQAQTMIEGTFMAWGLSAKDLPASFVASKSKRVDGKNVPTGEFVLKFPGQLRKPNEEGSTNAGRSSVSSVWTWTIKNGETEIAIGQTSIASLARLCSVSGGLLSFADLKERLDNHKWDSKDVTELDVRVPRGRLIGKRINK